MKIKLSQLGRSAGSALVFTVLLMGLVAILVSTYMTLVQNQNRATMRSQAWNSAVPLIEAGLEEALAHLNHNGVTNLGADGWTEVGGQYYRQRAVGDGFFIVGISNNGAQAVIRSQGYVDLPSSASASPSLMVAAVGSSLLSTHLGRGVEVLARADRLFSKGLVAKGQIDLKGNNINTDSFDSSDSDYSSGGLYDSSKAKGNGDVATNSGLVNSVSVGNANIKGKVSTGPGGSIAIGANGTVGSPAWHAAGNTGIEDGYLMDDMNVSFPDVTAPYTGGDPLSGGTYSGTSYAYLLPSGNYYLDSDLSLSSSATMLVTGDATLYITGDVELSGSASIQIEPGGSLKLYVGGSNAKLAGNGVINNAGNATNFFYYGLPSNTELGITGNGTFIGTIYAPNADLLLSGGGGTVTDVVGASITDSVTMNGHFNFHYDEALRNYGPPRTFVVTSWEEMLPDQLARLEELLLSGVLHKY